MQSSSKKSGLIFSLIGLVLAVAGAFLPWFDNGNLTVNAVSTVQNFGFVLVGLIAAAVICSAVLAVSSQNAESSQKAVFSGIRVLCGVIALYALMGVRKLMTAGPENLPVSMKAGAVILIIGIACLVIGAVIDFRASRESGRRSSTIDLVLIVMTAAIYAAALLTLSFIKLAPGTFLRPANALQAPFGILFGIPGCIGITLGNLISDLTQGTAPHVMVMGALTNFLTAFIPYLLVSNARLATRRSIIEFVIWGSIVGALIVASSIFINVMFGLTPKAVALAFFPTTFLNQLLPSLLLGIPLCKILYPFVIRSGLYRGRDKARDGETA